MTDNTNPVKIAEIGRMSLSDAVRSALDKLGKDARTESIRSYVRDELGIQTGSIPLQEEIVKIRGRRAEPRKKLTDADKYRLMQWLDNYRDRVKGEGMTKSRAVELIRAEAKLSEDGVKILTVDMVAFAAKTFGIKWHRDPGSNSKINKNATRKRLARIESWCTRVGEALGVPFVAAEEKNDE